MEHATDEHQRATRANGWQRRTRGELVLVDAHFQTWFVLGPGCPDEATGEPDRVTVDGHAGVRGRSSMSTSRVHVFVAGLNAWFGVMRLIFWSSMS